MSNFDKWKEARDAWRKAYTTTRLLQEALHKAKLEQDMAWHNLQVIAPMLTTEERLLAAQVEFGEPQ